MARKKQTKSVKSKKEESKKQGNSFPINFSSQYKLSDSYVSLFLGIVVVLIVVIIGVLIFKGRHNSFNGNVFGPQKEQQEHVSQKERTYTVVEGDDLWGIALKIYGSGFNWVDIAQANNLQSPDDIASGMVLKIPDVQRRNAE